MSNLSNEILEKIEKEQIKPTPKWRFLLKDSVVYITFIFNILVGALGISISLYLITNNDVIINQITDLSFIQSLIITIPVFWLVITAFFLFLAYYNFKHTEGGYRWSVAWIFLINIGVSVLIGLMLYFTGVSEKLNDFFYTSIPGYHQIADLRNQVWMRPEQGYLAGEIISIDENESTLQLKDLNNNIWTLTYDLADIKGRVHIIEGTNIKIIGKVDGTNKFFAFEIRPWSGMMYGNQNGMGMMQ